MSTGAELIAEERRRQHDDEGYTDQHDDIHLAGELASAAACYATPPEDRAQHMVTDGGQQYVNTPGTGYTPDGWPEPWEWKPTPGDRVRELVKAGALIAAEIDRLQRA